MTLPLRPLLRCKRAFNVSQLDPALDALPSSSSAAFNRKHLSAWEPEPFRLASTASLSPLHAAFIVGVKPPASGTEASAPYSQTRDNTLAPREPRGQVEEGAPLQPVHTPAS
eukprot:CAMPEP_0114123004 /NCGR_PEP_ID=MMETSP0043_2-20121206/7993_1 /TAXON_ID=464988 /ORGANISM="Hemiselmis andersenii, Strain CCMP644" /LENGTH=111 /DNA_ID=CAMNT_0001215749 /DNA_START=144 /DNA_END=477 /DNA_ORIENTATION=+